jgi:hypothetical protein
MRKVQTQAADRVPLRSELIGQGLVRARVLKPAQVEQILVIQRRDDERLFGEIAVDLGFTHDATIREYLDSRRKVGVLV